MVLAVEEEEVPEYLAVQEEEDEVPEYLAVEEEEGPVVLAYPPAPLARAAGS